MASVKVVEKRVVEEVVLTMTEAEASALARVLHNVGGSPDLTRREHTDAIVMALRSGSISFGPADTEGSIYFRSQS